MITLALATPAADTTGTTDLLFLVLTAISSAVVLLLLALVTTYCIRYRAGSGRGQSQSPTHVTAIETTWISATFVVFLGIAIWANIVFYRNHVAQPDAYTVYVIGKQWMWKLEHPNGRREINTLHVPVGEPIKLMLTSEDVIHSFYVPAFRIKQDAVPGRYTALNFVAQREGIFNLFCAEYCGTEHSGMVGRIIAMEPDDFAKWLGASPLESKPPGAPGTPQAPLARGENLFYRLGCSACHVQTGNVLAPRLDGLWGRLIRLTGGREVLVDENYIRESILNPNAKISAGYTTPSIMPSFMGVVSEEELIELVQYIRSIRYGWDGQPPAPKAAPADDFTDTGSD